MNALILVTSNDVRKKPQDKEAEKELTTEQKEDYFKCVELIMGAIDDENKKTVLTDTDESQSNALMWCCFNGNIQSASYLLDQCPDDKTKSSMIEQRDKNGENAFHRSIYGRNMDLIWKIHGVFKHFKKDEDLIKEDKALRVAFEQGMMNVVDAILFKLIDSKDSKKRMEFLNSTISYCKKGRKTEDAAKKIATRVLENDLGDIKEQEDIDNIYRVFEFMMMKDDLYWVKQILNRLSREKETKSNWFQTVNCLSYATENRPKLLRELLDYMDDYCQPLLEQETGRRRFNNTLIAAIYHQSEECASMLLDHVQSADVKDQLIATTRVKSNALVYSVFRKNVAMLDKLVKHHSDIEPLLGVSFLYCLGQVCINAISISFQLL